MHDSAGLNLSWDMESSGKVDTAVGMSHSSLEVVGRSGSSWVGVPDEAPPHCGRPVLSVWPLYPSCFPSRRSVLQTCSCWPWQNLWGGRSRQLWWILIKEKRLCWVRQRGDVRKNISLCLYLSFEEGTNFKITLSPPLSHGASLPFLCSLTEHRLSPAVPGGWDSEKKCCPWSHCTRQGTGTAEGI